jgi:acetylglutamate kinase
VTVVLKVGGASTAGVADAVARLRAAGQAVCVVHGAGPQISEEMARRGLEVRFVGGRRVTTPEALAVVRESLAAVNAAVCAAIGEAAVPLAGDEIGLRAEPEPELGLVGNAVPSTPAAVVEALAAGLVPVVTPLATAASSGGEAGAALPLNVNADEAAAALAVGLGAAKLLFLTDVAGVFQDGWLLRSIRARRAEQLVGDGVFEGGIVPKLLAAARAARHGLAAEIGATEVLA